MFKYTIDSRVFQPVYPNNLQNKIVKIAQETFTNRQIAAVFVENIFHL